MLLRQLVKVTSEEEERQRRLQSTPRLKTTHAHSAQIEGISEIKTAAATTEQTDKEIRKFITQVEALTDVVNSLKQPKGKEQNCQCMSKAPEKRRRSGCPNCIRQRKEETCSHCFICGGEDHRAVGCLNRQKSNAGSWDRMGGTTRKPRRRQPEGSGEKVVQFVGKKCLLEGEIGGHRVNMLLDTGAQVSIIDHDWRKEYLPTHDVRPLSEIVGPSAGLEVFAINGEVIPFSGWVEATVSLPGHDGTRYSIQVPFLVSQLQLERPLLGFNVISELITGPKDKAGILTTLHSLMSNMVNTQDDLVKVSVGFIRTNKVYADTARVRVGSQGVTICPGQVANVKCRVPPNFNISDSTVLFEPSEEAPPLACLDLGEGLIEVHKREQMHIRVSVGNHTKHEVTIPKRTILGEIAAIAKIIQTDQLEPTNPQGTVSSQPAQEEDDKTQWHPPIDLKSNFCFEIKYRPGKSNNDADMLSRCPLDMDQYISECTEGLSQRAIQATWEGNMMSKNEDVAWVAALNLKATDTVTLHDQVALAISPDELSRTQREDQAIGPVVRLKEAGKTLTPDVRHMVASDTLKLLREWHKLVLENNILYRRTTQRRQLVLPTKYRQMVLQQLHNHMSHVGTEKVLQKGSTGLGCGRVWRNM
ncbi:uncharacterized protein LOC109203576 [Tachysurus ichikawai]